MPRTILITHDICLRHHGADGVPEIPQRLAVILKALEGPEFAPLKRLAATPATEAQLRLAHPQDYIDDIVGLTPDHGLVALDEDTSLCPDSYQAAIHAAGAGCQGVDLVMTHEFDHVFCAVRPPGHHAEASRAMGFCIFANVAIAAAHAMTAYNVQKLAIIDFDVHHGNGTQSWASKNPGALFISSHQMPLWPGSGAAHEQGPHGNILNVPLPPGTGSAYFRNIYASVVFPAIARHAPELILISAGFDAHRADPLATIELDTQDYNWVTTELARLATQTPAKGRIVSMLEGGYNLPALADCAVAHVRALMAA